MLKRIALLTIFAVTAACSKAEPPQIMSAADLANFTNPPADARIQYGDGELQFGELRLPSGKGPHPVAVFIHGGCWLAEYDITHSNKLTDAFARNGIATWSLEYRRVGDEGGGWPGTFQDIANGADHLRTIAAEHNLDLDRVIVSGHSAGGHLALWTAARSQLSANSELAAENPLAVRGVLALAPAADLGLLHEEQVCGHVIDKLMGGSPADVPDRYRDGDTARLGPDDVPQILIIGKYDDNWAPAGLSYFAAAMKRGDDVQNLEAPESGHFDMIDPDSTTWPLVLNAARDLLDDTD